MWIESADCCLSFSLNLFMSLPMRFEKEKSSESNRKETNRIKAIKCKRKQITLLLGKTKPGRQRVT